MDTKNYIGIIVGLMVSGLILVAMVPIFTEVSATDDTFENDGYYDMHYVETDESVTLFWNPEEPNKITVGSEVVDLPVASPAERKTIVLGGDNIIFRYYGNPALIEITTTTSGAFVGDTPITIVCNEGVITATWGDNTKTGTYTKLYIPSNDGEFTMKQANQSAYVLGDSEIIAMGITQIDGTGKVIYIDGTIDDGVTFSSWDTELEFTDISVNAVSNSNHVDLYELSTITAKCGTTDITYSYFLVPSEVTAEKTIHGDTAFNSIIDILPMLAGVGLLMAGVYYFISRK